MATLINFFEVHPELDEQFIANWRHTRDYLKEHLGEMSTALYRSFGQEAEFRFVNIAQIEAVDEWRTVITSADYPGRGGPGQSVPALYEGIYEDHVSDRSPGAILINAFEVPEEDDSQFIASWSEARVVLSQHPGYLGSRLSQALEPTAAFRFVNVARWVSQAAFAEAAQSPKFAEVVGTMPYHSHLGFYEVLEN